MKTEEIYFTIEELVHSDTADEYHIINCPNKIQIENLKRLIKFLNPLRKAWGSAIIVNSGFRCQHLNAVVGGVYDSSHLTGNAVDIVPQNGKFDEFIEFLKDYLKDKRFDQCIIESTKYSRWVHFALYKNNGDQRHNIFEMKKEGSE